MQQEFRILRCFECETFQAASKNIKRWTCKICGKKQSVMREFGRGSGKKFREQIQNLNLGRKDFERAFCSNKNSDDCSLSKKEWHNDGNVLFNEAESKSFKFASNDVKQKIEEEQFNEKNSKRSRKYVEHNATNSNTDKYFADETNQNEMSASQSTSIQNSTSPTVSSFSGVKHQHERNILINLNENAAKKSKWSAYVDDNDNDDDD